MYYFPGPLPGGSGVTSYNTRTGAVVAESGDLNGTSQDFSAVGINTPAGALGTFACTSTAQVGSLGANTTPGSAGTVTTSAAGSFIVSTTSLAAGVLKATSGNLFVENTGTGALFLEATGGGGVTIQCTSGAGAINIKTTSTTGGITIQTGSGTLNLSSVSGQVQINTASASSSSWSTGAVTWTFPGANGLTLNATGGGSVSFSVSGGGGLTFLVAHGSGGTMEFAADTITFENSVAGNPISISTIPFIAAQAATVTLGSNFTNLLGYDVLLKGTIVCTTAAGAVFSDGTDGGTGTVSTFNPVNAAFTIPAGGSPVIVPFEAWLPANDIYQIKLSAGAAATTVTASVFPL